MGEQVRCPVCQQVFTAAVQPLASGEETTPNVGAFAAAFEGLEREPLPDEEEDEDAAGRPHRGELILTLGILGCLFCLCPLGGWLLGGCAMSLATTDIYQMATRRMDRSGRGMTKAGKILGAIAVTLSTIIFILSLVQFVTGTVRF